MISDEDFNRLMEDEEFRLRVLKPSLTQHPDPNGAVEHYVMVMQCTPLVDLGDLAVKVTQVRRSLRIAELEGRLAEVEAEFTRQDEFMAGLHDAPELRDAFRRHDLDKRSRLRREKKKITRLLEKARQRKDLL